MNCGFPVPYVNPSEAKLLVNADRLQAALAGTFWPSASGDRLALRGTSTVGRVANHIVYGLPHKARKLTDRSGR